MSLRTTLNAVGATLGTAMLGALLSVVPAAAQTCAVSITDMSFGSMVDTLSGLSTTTSATLSYTCSGGSLSDRVLICAHLGDGSVPATGGYRRLSSGSDYLNYQIYQTPDHSVVWGSAGVNSPPPIVAVLDGTGSASGQRPVYGRLSGGQSTAAAATYTSNFSGYIDVRYRITQDNACSTLAGTAAPPTSFTVDATVIKNCLVRTERVSFGAHGVLQSAVDATGTVSVLCTPSTDYTIRLNGGQAEAAPTARKMFKGAETITYGLFRNSGRDQPWGDTQGSMAGGSGNGTYQPHIVYGRVPAQVTPSAGTYTDTVIVIVDY